MLIPESLYNILCVFLYGMCGTLGEFLNFSRISCFKGCTYITR